MNKQVSTIVKQTEIAREVVLKRVPPGDRWCEPTNPELIFDTLTDGLEHIYQTYGDTEFYISARKGIVERLNVDEKEEQVIIDIPNEEPKRYSLYDE